MRPMRPLDESGQILPLVTVTLVGLLAVVGLVLDAGLLFNSRRNLQGIADAAARAGAGAIDAPAYRASQGRRVTLDPTLARRHALRRLSGVRVMRLEAFADRVEVKVARSQRLLLLHIVGVSPVTIEASSTARPLTGILTPGG